MHGLVLLDRNWTDLVSWLILDKVLTDTKQVWISCSIPVQPTNGNKHWQIVNHTIRFKDMRLYLIPFINVLVALTSGEEVALESTGLLSSASLVRGFIDAFKHARCFTHIFHKGYEPFHKGYEPSND